jgi:hypothetical protein
MRGKQYSVLRIRKVRALAAGEAERVDPALFALEKTETGQRGAATGTHPFRQGPEAMRRWAEALQWAIGRWRAGDIRMDSPVSAYVTREDITARVFPEIATENALEHLYRYRFLFSFDQAAGNPYELIADLHTYWTRTGIQRFRLRDQGYRAFARALPARAAAGPQPCPGRFLAPGGRAQVRVRGAPLRAA